MDVAETMSTSLRSEPRFRREYIVVSYLLVNTFSWLFIGQKIVTYLFAELSSASLIFPASIIISMFIGAAFLSNVQKTKFFSIWLLFGTVSSLVLIFPLASSFIAIFSIILMGISIGLGLPSCLTFFANHIPIEKRGKTGGICLFLAAFSVPLITSVMPDLATSVAVFALWRGSTLPILFFIPKNDHHKIVRKPHSLTAVLQNKTFILYFIAWLMFSLVDGFETSVLENYIGEFRFLMTTVEPIFAGISAVVGGILSDWIGRKRVLIFGFVSLGVAYAIASLASELWISWVFYFVVDGTALGILGVLFILVIWGDLSSVGQEKYYAFGETPLFLAMIVSRLFYPYTEFFHLTSAFSLAAFFLFIAVIPLIYAPETLPQKKIEQRQLQIYTQEALKVKQKIEQKEK